MITTERSLFPPPVSKKIRRGGGEGRAPGWEREGTVVGEVGEVGGADEEVHGVATQAREEHEVHR